MGTCIRQCLRVVIACLMQLLAMGVLPNATEFVQLTLFADPSVELEYMYVSF